MIRFNLKEILFPIVVIIGMIAIYLSGKFSAGDEISDLKNIIRTEQDKTKTWKDEAGHWRSKSEAAEIKSNDALKYLSEHDSRYESLSNEFQGLKKNLKNLQYAGFTGSSSTYEIHPETKDTLVVLHHDTTRAKSFNYADTCGWFTAKGLILPDGEIPYLFVSTKDSLVTAVIKHKKLFKATSYTQEIKSLNPHTKVVYNESVIVNKPKKFLGIF